MTTPRAVLEAGNDALPVDMKLSPSQLDRVFRAMLRAQINLLEIQDEPDWEVLTRLLALAGDDHG